MLNINTKFNNDEYIKLKTKFKNHPWYNDSAYKIKQYHKRNIYYPNNVEDYYILYSNNEFITLNKSLVFQDFECTQLNRKEKLKKISECQK